MLTLRVQTVLIALMAIVASMLSVPSSVAASLVEDRSVEIDLETRSFGVWAQFCGDSDGKQCSGSFEITNPGCFSAGGSYVKFHSDAIHSNDRPYSLIISPSGGCPCQNGKRTFTPGDIGSGNVFHLDQTGGSYRFIEGNGENNNC